MYRYVECVCKYKIFLFLNTQREYFNNIIISLKFEFVNKNIFWKRKWGYFFFCLTSIFSQCDFIVYNIPIHQL